jgi:hypothetical protein
LGDLAAGDHQSKGIYLNSILRDNTGCMQSVSKVDCSAVDDIKDYIPLSTVSASWSLLCMLRGAELAGSPA